VTEDRHVGLAVDGGEALDVDVFQTVPQWRVVPTASDGGRGCITAEVIASGVRYTGLVLDDQHMQTG